MYEATLEDGSSVEDRRERAGWLDDRVDARDARLGEASQAQNRLLTFPLNCCRIHQHPSLFAPANSSPTDSWLAANLSLTLSIPRCQTWPRTRFRRSSRPSTRLTRTVSLPLASEHTLVVDEAQDLPSSTMMRLHRRSLNQSTD